MSQIMIVRVESDYPFDARSIENALNTYFRTSGDFYVHEQRLTKRAVDEGDSAPLQAESMPEHLPIEEAESTPALRN